MLSSLGNGTAIDQIKTDRVTLIRSSTVKRVPAENAIDFRDVVATTVYRSVEDNRQRIARGQKDFTTISGTRVFISNLTLNSS